MLYAVLIYSADPQALTQDEIAALLARHAPVQEKLAAEGKLGPVLRLAEPATATTLKKQSSRQSFTDGPFAETKEQLMGLYLVQCASLEEAQEAARLIGDACNSIALELRPVGLYQPGGSIESVRLR